MTEVILDKQTFLKTLHAIRTQFELASPSLTIETEPEGKRFALTVKRNNASDVRAFGPCEVKGNAVSTVCNISDLESAIVNAYEKTNNEILTLLIGDGIWVKDPHSAEAMTRI